MHIWEGGFGMKQITSYSFNMDTACVELRFSDGTMLAIDTIAVENEFTEKWLDRRELDFLIYNGPHATILSSFALKHSPSRQMQSC